MGLLAAWYDMMIIDVVWDSISDSDTDISLQPVINEAFFSLKH